MSRNENTNFLDYFDEERVQIWIYFISFCIFFLSVSCDYSPICKLLHMSVPDWRLFQYLPVPNRETETRRVQKVQHGEEMMFYRNLEYSFTLEDTLAKLDLKWSEKQIVLQIYVIKLYLFIVSNNYCSYLLYKMLPNNWLFSAYDYTTHIHPCTTLGQGMDENIV